MDTTTAKPEKKKVVRSRMGCQKCKKVKKKCDELKPVCSYCIKKGFQDECNYAVPIRLKNVTKKKMKETKDVTGDKLLQSPIANAIMKTNFPQLEDNSDVNSGLAMFGFSPSFGQGTNMIDEKLKTNMDELFSKNMFSPGIGSPLNFLLSNDTENRLNEPFLAEENKALDEEGGSEIINIKPYLNQTKKPDTMTLYSNKSFPMFSINESMPTPIPILSQSLTYQSFLPFNISFKNQKILNFYETFTASFLTPGFHFNEDKLSPFRQYIPKFVNKDKDLMKLILLFAKTHMSQLGINYSETPFSNENEIPDDQNSFSSGMTTDNRIKNTGGLLALSDISFLDRIASQSVSEIDTNDLGTYTLKQMVLISLHTFFPGASNVNWRKCMQNAKTGILKTSKKSEMFNFLNHWLCYQELMSSLTTSNLALINKNSFEYHFNDDTLEKTRSPDSTAYSLDIDKFSGMDRQILKYLNKGVKLLQSFNTDEADKKLSVQIEAMELIIEMEKYMIESELERDQLVIDDEYLRITNKIFGKITLHLLKRRILNIQIAKNEKIRESLIEIVDLIEKLPFTSAYSSCVFFAMFISGCDLIIYDDLIEKRQIILNHLELLYKNIGMESCQRVINYMLQCWLTKKSWWEVFVDNDIDIIFTI